ncbi:MAG: hypothetical protein ABI114_16350 [Rhodanobacter sp.]
MAASSLSAQPSERRSKAANFESQQPADTVSRRWVHQPVAIVGSLRAGAANSRTSIMLSVAATTTEWRDALRINRRRCRRSQAHLFKILALPAHAAGRDKRHKLRAFVLFRANTARNIVETFATGVGGE